MDIPNEILALIFQQFNSRRYLTTCSLVCKKWNLVINNPIFYKDIYIYTFDQYRKFLRLAIRQKLNDKPITQYVQRITFLIIESPDYLSLKEVFPNLTTIRFRRDLYNSFKPSYIIKGGEIKTSIKDNDVILSYYMIDDKDKDNITIHKLPKGIQLYTYNHQPLTEISLMFDITQVNEMDFNFLDTLCTTCPHLLKLTLHNIDFNDQRLRLTTNNINEQQLTSSTFKQWEKLKSLSLVNVIIYQPTLFTYIKYFHPNLESLEMKKITLCNKYISDTAENSSIFTALCKQEIFSMFNTLTSSSSSSLRLKVLKIMFSDLIGCMIGGDALKKFYDLSHLVDLKNTALSADIISTENIFNNPSFLQHLHTLGLTLTLSAWKNIKSYLKNNIDSTTTKNKIFSSNLTTLALSTLDYKKGGEKIQCHIFDWLDLFPKLTTLELSKMEIHTIEKKEKVEKKQKYPLQRLTISESKILMEEAFSIICQHCPLLTTLHCLSSSMFCPILIHYVDVFKPKVIHYQLLNAPHINMKELKMSSNVFFANDLLHYSPTNIDTVINTPSSHPKTQFFDFTQYHMTSRGHKNHIRIQYNINLKSIDRFFHDIQCVIY